MALRGLSSATGRSCTGSAASGALSLPRLARHVRNLQPASTKQNRVRWVARANPAEEDAEWEREMSIFKQRIMRPNQLETLRELESKVNVGKASPAGPLTQRSSGHRAGQAPHRQEKAAKPGPIPSQLMRGPTCRRSCTPRTTSPSSPG